MGTVRRAISALLFSAVVMVPAASNGTVFVKTLTFDDPDDVDGLFGWGLAPLGTNVVVGAPYNGTGGSGEAYLFNSDTGALLRQLDNPTPAPMDLFGWAAAVHDGDLLLTAVNDDTNGTDAGAVYRIDPDTGSLLQTYLPPGSGGAFGISIAVRGDDLVIGALHANSGAGAIYVVDAATGTTELTLNNVSGTYYFGWSIGVVGNDVIVGGLGRVTLFDGTTGSVIREFQQPIGGPGADFGRYLSVFNNQVLISAPGTFPAGAYLFDALTGALALTITGGGAAVLHLGDGRLLVGEADSVRVHDASTGTVLQTLPSIGYSLARGPGRLFTFNGDVYEEQACATMECDPNTDPCCDADTCRFDKCDPSEDPCCDATTCDFVQCNPEVNPCCDAGTCSFKATNALCVQNTGAGAGCKTGQCNASHVCQAVAATNIDNGTECVAQVNSCFSGQCNNGVCQPPDGPSTPWANRCQDTNACTDDADACKQDVFGAFVRCAFKDPAIHEAAGTSCSTASGAICTIKECQAGECQPVSPPQTIDCSMLPQVQTCHFNSCRLNASNQPECFADQLVPAGTVCESTVGSTDWDCKHYRCSSRGKCQGKRAIDGKVCDFQPLTTPAAHCRLGTCSAKAQCLNPLYSTIAVVQDMETAPLDSDGNPVEVDLPTCPNDGNMCTVDRCQGGMTDACINPCTTGVECGVPGVCEGTCQIISSICQCAEAP